ncbi:3722_t:CDS:1, partial [Racocetra persica]
DDPKTTIKLITTSSILVYQYFQHELVVTQILSLYDRPDNEDIN